MSVSEYADKFKDMVAYYREVVYAPDELWKINPFLFGMRADIAHSLFHREFNTYARCLRQCYVSDNSLKRIQEEREKGRLGHKEQVRSGEYLKP